MHRARLHQRRRHDTIPLTATVEDSDGDPEPSLNVYAFDGASYTGYNKTTDTSGEAVFTLPQGDYRFRVDKDGQQYWSGEANHYTVPGCEVVTITLPNGQSYRVPGLAAPVMLPKPSEDESPALVASAQASGGGELVTRTITYTYDGLYRLTEADYSSSEKFE